MPRAEQDTSASQIAELLRTQPSADIVVGLPSYNNAGTIAGVVQSVRQGLAQGLADKRAIIINVDGGSSDGTIDRSAELQGQGNVALAQVRLTGQDFVVPYHGIAGKAEALHVTLRVARQTGAGLCLMLSPDFTAFAPHWVEQLAAPIVQHGFDFALPLYLRHKLDGAITSSIVRPLVRALYGRRVQQPMGGEYAFSAALVERYLEQNVWGTDLAKLGSDIWTTTQAMCEPFKMCHVQLGCKKQARSSAPVELGATLSQVLGALFEDMTRNAHVWQRVRGSLPIATLGAPGEGAPTPVNLDFRKLIESFRLGLRNLQDVWSLVLAPATLIELRRAAELAPEHFTLPDVLWCRVLFDFSLGYRLRTINRSHLLAAFLPLYLGWLGAFVREMQDASDSDTENRVEQLCRSYEAEKPYLISRWRSPDRFNP
jgi:glucosylglycerate synthase